VKFRIRKLAALVMLVSAVTQPAAGSALLASAAVLGLHRSSHAHSVSVVAEEGHLHLVLSHDDRARGDHDHAPSPSGPSFAEPDHVFHMTGDDAASATSRRVALDPTPPLAIAVVLPSTPALAWSSRPSPETRARSSDLLRSVVLRRGEAASPATPQARRDAE